MIIDYVSIPAGTRRLHDVEKWSLFGHDVGDVVQTLDWRLGQNIFIALVL